MSGTSDRHEQRLQPQDRDDCRDDSRGQGVDASSMLPHASKPAEHNRRVLDAVAGAWLDAVQWLLEGESCSLRA